MDDRTSAQGGVVDPEPFKLAVIGGGPLFTAWRLAAETGSGCQITVFEASDHLGGKIQTGQFAGVPV